MTNETPKIRITHFFLKTCAMVDRTLNIEATVCLIKIISPKMLLQNAECTKYAKLQGFTFYKFHARKYTIKDTGIILFQIIFKCVW